MPDDFLHKLHILSQYENLDTTFVIFLFSLDDTNDYILFSLLYVFLSIFYLEENILLDIISSILFFSYLFFPYFFHDIFDLLLSVVFSCFPYLYYTFSPLSCKDKRGGENEIIHKIMKLQS